jgi:glycine/D-amino acid oxidase-like deaminating enzyme
MNLHSHTPFWLMKHGYIHAYPALQADIKSDIVIMGAGISGALIAQKLLQTGQSITLIDKRHAGMGSTAASTAFLQYEIDTPLTRLADYVGEQEAAAAYELCREAIYKIRDLCKDIRCQASFHLRPSLQYASYRSHVADLEKEYKLRRQYGFSVEWLQQKEVQDLYGFAAPAALLSADGAEVDAYMLTHALLQEVVQAGHKVYNNTEIVALEQQRNGVILHTAHGQRIQAKKLIIACGYESLRFLPKNVADIHATYALISEPLPEGEFWHRNSLVWETASPYLYFRTTDDSRILVGGKDDPYHNPGIRNKKITQKAAALQAAFQRKMPHIPLHIDFAWAGAFGITKDGLPYLGSIPEMKHTFFALCFGGNGITFSVIAAQMALDYINGKEGGYEQLFGFSR